MCHDVEMVDTSEACSMLLLSGMTPAEMHACLVEGQMEVARARIAQLKRLVSTFTGEMLLVINEAQSEPFISSFAGMEEAGYADVQQGGKCVPPLQWHIVEDAL